MNKIKVLYCLLTIVQQWIGANKQLFEKKNEASAIRKLLGKIESFNEIYNKLKKKI